MVAVISVMVTCVISVIITTIITILATTRYYKKKCFNQQVIAQQPVLQSDTLIYDEINKQPNNVKMTSNPAYDEEGKKTTNETSEYM